MTAWMAQLPSRGYQTWVCACGRLGLALAVDTCPDCGQPQPGTAPATAPSPEPETAAAPRRTRTRAAKGG